MGTFYRLNTGRATNFEKIKPITHQQKIGVLGVFVKTKGRAFFDKKILPVKLMKNSQKERKTGTRSWKRGPFGHWI